MTSERKLEIALDVLYAAKFTFETVKPETAVSQLMHLYDEITGALRIIEDSKP